ncbi:Cof-like hydrolase [Ethanoligenens harbinense YUAN-3]|uniref:Cof-like hydrolase n=2 Tax=Ethanoligenens harbinense TaxID=253239 RepID=E6U336_ETHHY|nr:Cof-like hydrolase [Ethanoligenens harbinense YUAN-3]
MRGRLKWYIMKFGLRARFVSCPAGPFGVLDMLDMVRRGIVLKLVASDMDGTLLNSQKELPAHLFPVLRQLFDRGVRFAVASGRQYYNLRQLFEPVQEQVSFISENGAMVIDRGRSLWVSEIPEALVTAVVEAIRGAGGLMPVLSGEKSAYVDSDVPFFMENVALYYTRCQRVGDVLEAARRDRICKIAVFDMENAETHAYPLLQPFDNALGVVLSGTHWVDLMNPGVNKGEAIRVFQKEYGIAPDECMAFGDYLNDYEMLQVCGENYAMANAHPKLKAVSRHVAKSNDENGVVDAICSVFGIQI